MFGYGDTMGYVDDYNQSGILVKSPINPVITLCKWGVHGTFVAGLCQLLLAKLTNTTPYWLN